MSSPADPTRSPPPAVLAGLSRPAVLAGLWCLALALTTLHPAPAQAGAVAAPLPAPADASAPATRVAAAGKAAATGAAPAVATAAAAAPSAPGRGRIEADDDDTASPASGVPGAAPAPRSGGGYRMRCWQYGQLLFDEGPVVLPAEARRNARLSATDKRGNLVLVSDVGGGTTCLTAQR